MICRCAEKREHPGKCRHKTQFNQSFSQTTFSTKGFSAFVIY